MTIIIHDDLAERLTQEANGLARMVEERLVDILDRSLAPQQNFDQEYLQAGLENIKTLLTKIPCVRFVAISEKGAAFWWLKFGIDIDSKIAWTVVQELAHILNYLSVDDKLPTTFYPVSPPPYMNGGPEEFLSWIIEPVIPYVDTNKIYDYLNGRLPENYDKEENWLLED